MTTKARHGELVTGPGFLAGESPILPGDPAKQNRLPSDYLKLKPRACDRNMRGIFEKKE